MNDAEFQREFQRAMRQIHDVAAQLRDGEAGLRRHVDRMRADLLLDEVWLGLKCAECGRRSFEADRGWRAYHTDDEPPAVAVFCPDCSKAEFDA
jgi:ribosomal protein L44E